MNRSPNELRSLHESACEAAEAVLIPLGFKKEKNDEFRGTLKVSGIEIPLRVVLPESFPWVLPHLFVKREELPKRVPHVEANGKVCLLPNTGILIDSSRPADVLRDALERAHSVLEKGLEGENVGDFISEFQAYWNAAASIEELGLICPVDPPSREIVVISYDDSGHPKGIVANDLRSARTWLQKRGLKRCNFEKGYLYHLTRAFIPPDFNETVSIKEAFAWLKNNSAPAMYAYFKREFDQCEQPFVVLISFPTGPKNGWTVCGIRITPKAVSSNPNQSKGSSNEVSPEDSEVSNYDESICRVSIKRFDAGYLLPRAGATQTLNSKQVIVVGCGAIGSALATHLASMGAGNVVLIDPDTFSADNVHRHTLGFQYIGVQKARALRHLLQTRFPHLDFEYRTEQVEKILEKELTLLESADLVAITIGDETIELLLNDALRFTIPRIHAWVDPLGLGGHVLAIAEESHSGCYRCLFGEDAKLGLFNKASFVAPGQEVHQTFAGCAGYFAPFSYQDADQTAIHAARLALQVVQGVLTKNLLLSWFGDPKDAIERGIRLSHRVREFNPGMSRVTAKFANPCCVCANWQ